MSQERWIEIPEEVRDIYKIWRPTPMFRAHRLEKLLDTPAKIFYKYEGGSPAGSHKPNTAIPQAYYNKKGKFNMVLKKRQPYPTYEFICVCVLFLFLFMQIFRDFA